MQVLPKISNLLQNDAANQERIFELLHADTAKLEHIVSNGKASEPGFWYDQQQDEWVCLIQGAAELEFENGILSLKAGDALTIPAQCKHRVRTVSQDAVWLALHFSPSQ